MNENCRSCRLVVNNAAQSRAIAGVYLVTDEGDNLLVRTLAALRGGVSALQYRAKSKDRARRLSEASQLMKICRDFGAAFIVNDSVSLAAELDADGVHLGQDDGSIAAARAALGPGKIIGKSTHNLDEALRAQEEGADYIGFGAMYPTSSKIVDHLPGTTGLSAIRSRIKLPIVAIGGITHSNACRVIDAGADALAVISSVLSSSRPDIAALELRLLFNRQRVFPKGAVLTVAGSDSGGGAGIQADIKTITLLGSYAASALTALTAQNTKGVASIHSLPPSFITSQLNSVLSDIPIDVVKTGMLHTPAIVSALAENLSERKHLLPVVVDPVMLAKGGAALMERDAFSTFVEQLLPLAYLITPNIPEAERLLGKNIQTETEAEQAARDLHALGAANVLIKGGHLSGEFSNDILFDGAACYYFRAKRFFTSNTHGTGCTYSSSIAAFLAQGEPLNVAVKKAKEFITDAIQLARPLGKGHSPVNHFAAAERQRALHSPPQCEQT